MSTLEFAAVKNIIKKLYSSDFVIQLEYEFGNSRVEYSLVVITL